MALRFFLFLGTVLLLTGCFETKDEYTFNPDGSGKLVRETYFQPFRLTNDRESLISAED